MLFLKLASRLTLLGLPLLAIAEAFQNTASERLREGAKLNPVLSVLVIGEEWRKIPYLTFAGWMSVTLNKPKFCTTAILASFVKRLIKENGDRAGLPGAL